jgi:hypothetical protein
MLRMQKHLHSLQMKVGINSDEFTTLHLYVLQITTLCHFLLVKWRQRQSFLLGHANT